MLGEDSQRQEFNLFEITRPAFAAAAVSDTMTTAVTVQVFQAELGAGRNHLFIPTDARRTCSCLCGSKQTDFPTCSGFGTGESSLGPLTFHCQLKQNRDMQKIAIMD